MTLRVYVAASQHEYKRARAAMFELRFAGCTISHDWTLEVGNYPATSDDQKHEAAIADYRGVVECDVLLVLTPEREDWGCAMYTELGIALDRFKRCIIVGPQRERNIFAYLCERYVTDQDGIDAIVEEM
jgi:hypothetical protein